MDLMKLQKREEVGHEDLFARMPNELLFLILSRIRDLKFLCQCTLVSKHFALTIYHIQTVSITLPGTEMPYTQSAESIRNLFPQILDHTTEEITGIIQSSSIQKLKFSLFLPNFSQLKSIYLEFTCPGGLCGYSLLKWKAKLKSRGAMVESLVTLVATSVHKRTRHELDEEQEDQETSNDVPSYRITGDIMWPLRWCRDWLCVLCLLVKCQPSLQSVTITDSKKQGRLLLRDEQLVEWRRNLLSGGFSINFSPQAFNTIWIPELHLPLSGYVLESVYFMVMGFRSELDSITNYDAAMAWEYEEDEKLLAEAVQKIFTDHRDRFLSTAPDQFYQFLSYHWLVF